MIKFILIVTSFGFNGEIYNEHGYQAREQPSWEVCSERADFFNNQSKNIIFDKSSVIAKRTARCVIQFKPGKINNDF